MSLFLPKVWSWPGGKKPHRCFQLKLKGKNKLGEEGTRKDNKSVWNVSRLLRLIIPFPHQKEQNSIKSGDPVTYRREINVP